MGQIIRGAKYRVRYFMHLHSNTEKEGNYEFHQ